MFGGSRDAKFIQTTIQVTYRWHRTPTSLLCRVVVDHLMLSSVTEPKVLADLFRWSLHKPVLTKTPKFPLRSISIPFSWLTTYIYPCVSPPLSCIPCVCQIKFFSRYTTFPSMRMSEPWEGKTGLDSLILSNS